MVGSASSAYWVEGRLAEQAVMVLCHGSAYLDSKKARWENPSGLRLRGAPYRIRTYDALIRSQVLYPAEVTARAVR